jgi:hypothetical protein
MRWENKKTRTFSISSSPILHFDRKTRTFTMSSPSPKQDVPLDGGKYFQIRNGKTMEGIQLHSEAISNSKWQKQDVPEDRQRQDDKTKQDTTRNDLTRYNTIRHTTRQAQDNTRQTSKIERAIVGVGSSEGQRCDGREEDHKIRHSQDKDNHKTRQP